MTDTTRLRELLTEITPGDWKLWGAEVWADPKGTSSLADAIQVAATTSRRTWDAEFIALARNTLPALLAERDADKARIVELERELKATRK